MATTRKQTEEVTPEQPKGLFQKLHMAKQHIGKVAKNATNPHFKKPTRTSTRYLKPLNRFCLRMD